MTHHSAPELSSDLSSETVSLDCMAEYQAGCSGWDAYIPVMPPLVLEEPFCVHCGRVDVVEQLPQGSSSFKPGPVIEEPRFGGSVFRVSDHSVNVSVSLPVFLVPLVFVINFAY